MNFYQRGITYIKRQAVKSSVLFLLVFILATVSLGAMSVRTAIYNTEDSLQLRLPAVATLYLNSSKLFESIDDSREINLIDSAIRPTIEEISQVGESPYVRVYDFFIHESLGSQEFSWAPQTSVDVDIAQGFLETEMADMDIAFSQEDIDAILSGMQFGLRSLGGYVESFPVHGVNNSNLTDIETGLLQLVDGRTFTEEEISNATPVILISQSFADTNNLGVGSIVSFDNFVPDLVNLTVVTGSFTSFWHLEEYLLASETLQFEIIGVYDVKREFVYDSYLGIDALIREEAGLHNRIYMPIQVAEDVNMFAFEERMEQQEKLRELNIFSEADIFEPEDPTIEAIFILHDSRDLTKLTDAASELLPEFWEVRGLNAVNSNVMSSMDTVLTIADFILFATALATGIILTLIITLSLYNRRYEVGVYLALGEKKTHIIFQFLTEIFLICALAVALAFFTGNRLSNMISRYMLEQTLTEQLEVRANEPRSASEIPWELALLDPGEMSVEELMDIYRTSLYLETIVIFIAVGTVVILLSTAIPIAYVVKLEPKKVLM